MKSALKELGVIEELVLNRAAPAETRGHIIELRRKLNAVARRLSKQRVERATHSLLGESYSKLQDSSTQAIAALEKEKAIEIAKRDTVIRQLQAKNKELEAQLFAYHTGNVFRL